MEQLADLQAQIDRLSLALHQWRETQDHLQPVERRLLQLTERCSEILARWAETDERHAHAVSEVEERLAEWGALESQWKALRESHEGPAAQLREQAASISETCMAAANLAMRGFERAESRFAALEGEIQTRLSALTRDVQALGEAQRAAALPELSAPVEPFPLDGIVRIHEGLRQGDGSAPPAPSPASDRSLIPAGPVPPVANGSLAALVDRLDSMEREAADETRRQRRLSRWALGGLTAALVAVSALGVRFQIVTSRRLDDATARVAAAERQAESVRTSASIEVATMRAAAERQIAEARQSAQTAQALGSILSAPDLVRYGLTGAAETAPRAVAQVLWSRTRGLVVSAASVPPPPAGQAYRVWLIGAGTAVPAGALVPDAAGRATLAADVPASAPRPVVGVIVTIEPAGDVSAPAGPTLLSRIPQ